MSQAWKKKAPRRVRAPPVELPHVAHKCPTLLPDQMLATQLASQHCPLLWLMVKPFLSIAIGKESAADTTQSQPEPAEQI